MDCLFCKIASKAIPSDVIYEDEQVLAFSDIRPQAPIHKLIIPKQHIPTLNDVQPEDLHLISKLFATAQQLAQQFEIAQDGYRCVFNCNANAGQEVYHLHLHLLGGRRMLWPPG